MLDVNFGSLIALGLLILIISLKYSSEVIQQSHFNENYPDVFTVETKTGRVRGKLNETLFDKKYYYSFRGIPYGKAPIGDLRFKAPVEAEPWTGTLDAFEYGQSCLQQNVRNEVKSEGAEDCLNLHIFVPAQSLMSNESLAVMFTIVGGRFVWDLARDSRPDFFINEDIIIVMAQHRVGPFGFLSLGLPEYSGNMGLKDQLLALEWVNKNIESFGGDKNRITFFGHSSGSMSASLHILNSKSRKLFQKAILFSGSAMNPVLPRVKDHTSIVQNLADLMYYPITNEDDLVEFLKQVDGASLSKFTYQNGYYPGLGRKGLTRVWNVVVEKENAIDPMLTKLPTEITLEHPNRNNIDTLFLYTQREFTFEREYLNPELLDKFDKQFEITFPLFMPNFRSKEYKVAAEKIRKFYFNEKPIEYETLANLNQLMSDIKFVYGINLNARIQAAQSSGRTYVSRFSVVNDWNLSAIRHKLSDGKVIYYDHCDPTQYIFRENPGRKEFPDSVYTELSHNSEPYKLIKNITTFFADFVKFGNPMPNQDPIQFKLKNSDQYNYFDITSQGIIVKSNLFKKQMDFWDDIMCMNQTYDRNNFT